MNPDYGFDNTGVTMAIDETLMCSFKVPKALEEKIASMLTELRELAGVVMILAMVHLNFMTVTLMAYIVTLVLTAVRARPSMIVP